VHVQQLGAFPDAEAVVMTLLATIPGVTAVTATPPQITGPVVQVNRVGGADDLITDYPRVQVALFYPVAAPGDTDAAWALAQQITQLVLAARCTTVAGALVDQAVTVTPVQQVPNDNPNVRRIVAVYQLAFRRPRS
jgi:hypothetical protein